MPAKRTRQYKSRYQEIKAKQLRDWLKKNKVKGSTSANIAGRNIEFIEKKSGFGYRLYLLCPYCYKPKNKLTLMNGVIGCPKCLGLHHETQSESEYTRLRRLILNKRRALWGANSIHSHDIGNFFEVSYFWTKPYRMRQTTFEKKRDELSLLETKYMEKFLIPEMDRIINRSKDGELHD